MKAKVKRPVLIDSDHPTAISGKRHLAIGDHDLTEKELDHWMIQGLISSGEIVLENAISPGQATESQPVTFRKVEKVLFSGNGIPPKVIFADENPQEAVGDPAIKSQESEQEKKEVQNDVTTEPEGTVSTKRVLKRSKSYVV